MLISKFVKDVFPLVDLQLNQWIDKCDNISDKMLKKQALSSIANKRFHAQGGSVYSLYPGTMLENTISFIVAFQTISDYLDNLCDRADVLDETAFRKLHEAMLDAVDPSPNTHDYYLYYPYKDDGGYLKKLVEECKLKIRSLPSYKIVETPIKNYVKNYSNLQALKHLSTDIRESKLKDWATSLLLPYPALNWWEISAATGSTLGIFILFSAAHNPLLTSDEVYSIAEAYFPWVTGLHILLDYFIDIDEDKKNGDLNFISFYENIEQCKERLIFFLKNSLNKCSALRYPSFHHTVIKGLIAMYLSDSKAKMGLCKHISRSMLNKSGLRTVMYYEVCVLLRRMRQL